MDQYIGKMLDNRYEPLELIGRGGMANVYKAKDHRLNRLVAVKVLKSDFADNAEFRRRFHDESQAVAQLSHANIVSVYDVSRSDDLDYIVMELIDGITLKQYMERRGKMDWRESLHFIIQIMRGLSHAHSRGVIHRDIKPQNIMVLRDGSVKVADFGIACLTNASQTLTQEALGSVHYISPEQARGDRIDARSDIYSAGVVLYEMLTGRLPFEGDSAVSVAIQHLSSVPLAPRDINPEVPEALELITMKAMNPSLEKRYPSAEAMLDDLESFRKDPNVDMEHIRAQLQVMPPVEEPTQHLPAEELAAMTGRGKRKGAKEDGTKADKKKMAIIFGSFAAALLLVFLIFSLIGNGLHSGNKPVYYEVPNLVGYTVAEANELPTIKGIFTIVQRGARYESGYQPGQIIEQDPKEGRKRDSSGDMTIIVYVCAEEEKTSMPYLIGMDLQEAKAQLISLGFDLDIRTPVGEFSDEYKENQIIRTSPESGADLKKGSQVILYYSKGSEERPVDVPTFVGKTVSEATSLAQELKLVVGQHDYQYSDQPKDTVIEQSIPEGGAAKEGDTIVFTISRGQKLVEIRDYTEGGTATFEKASAAATRDGFSVGEPVYQFSDRPEGTVLGQSLEDGTPLAAGAQVPEGATILFTVSKAQSFTVTFADGFDGATIATHTVNAGERTPDAPALPSHEGQRFVGWSPAIASTVTEDVTYTAQWEPTSAGETGGGN